MNEYHQRRTVLIGDRAEGILLALALATALPTAAGCAADPGPRSGSGPALGLGAEGKPEPAPTGRSYRPGYYHTRGAQIVTADGTPVRITGINWFGLETPNFTPHGLWSRSLASILDQVKALGYNALRLPYSSELFDPGSTPNSIDFNLNPDLRGNTGLEIMDAVIKAAGERGLKIILDRHRPDAGAQSPLWYTDRYPASRWISDWQMLARRYLDDPTVIGCDLHNEPHATASWGDGNPATDWKAAAEQAGDAILAINPDLLIVVEGVENAGGSAYWWGGNLRNAIAHPVTLAVPDQVVYSPHDYPASVAAQPWFTDPSYPANLPGVWDEYFGDIVTSGEAPVLIGEFGTRDQTASDGQWLAALTRYIAARGLSFTFWCMNPNSGDTGGILADDWQTVNADKQAALAPILAPLLP